MSLALGTRLGPYEILSAIGEGGMGEVYRARDTKLNRDVAIKVLPAAFANDPDRLARFSREAQTLASLNHPNILSVHDTGTDTAGPASITYIVTELLHGDTLRERLNTGRLPVRKAIEIASQIARGLAAAHDKGIVHRDLKPENLFLLADGQVKILDFGLAKAVSSGSGASETVAAVTEPGSVMGTAGYMAPEQVRAHAADARTDLFALGAILFEILAGRRAFQHGTTAETMTAILNDDPPELAGAQSQVSPALDRIVRHSLEKNPAERFQSARDMSFALEALSGSQTSAMPVPAVGRARSRTTLPWIVAGAALAVAAAASAWALTRPKAAPPDIWQFTQITDTGGEETTPAISPDGTTVMFASRARGTWDIYAQRVGGRNRTLVIGDSVRQEQGPAFSPDGQQVAFYEGDDDGGIFVAGATGESVRRVSETGFHPSWSPDGTHLAFTTEQVITAYTSQGTSKLWAIDLMTGGAAPQQLDLEDARQPSWSPSGRRIVFWSVLGGQRDLFTVASNGGARVPLLVDAPVDWAPVWTPDGAHVLFSSDRGGAMNLWRIAIDESTGRALSDPEPVTTGVQSEVNLPGVSRSGSRIVFESRVRSVNAIAIAFDPVTLRAGVPVVLDSSNGILTPTDVSRDGRALLLYSGDGHQSDIFWTGTDHFAPVRITDDEVGDRRPMWMPGGQSVLFYSMRGGKWEIWQVNRDGGNVRKIVSLYAINPLVSPTGDRVAFSATLDWGVYVEPLTGGLISAPQPLPGTRTATATLRPTSWSPDGRSLAGPLVPAGGRGAGIAIYDIATHAMRQVSADSSAWVRWMPDSRRLIYFTARGELVVLDTQSGGRTVVNVRLPLPPTDNTFALSPDARTIYYGGERSESDIWVMERKKR